MKRLLLLAINYLEELHQIHDKVGLKKFISEFGLDGYHYLIELSKQKSKAFSLNDQDSKDINTIYESIRNNSEPVFIKDLALNGNDLKTAGVLEGKEIGRVLDYLLDIVHVSPEKNEKQILLEIVKEITANSRTNC